MNMYGQLHVVPHTKPGKLAFYCIVSFFVLRGHLKKQTVVKIEPSRLINF